MASQMLRSVRINELRVASARPATRAVRASAVTVASASRREALSALVGAASLAVAAQAQAVTAIAVKPVTPEALRIIRSNDEARDVDLQLEKRFAITKLDIAGTKARIAKAKTDLAVVSKSIDKQYWTDAKEGLRRAVYYLRYDIDTLSAQKSGKAAKKAAEAASSEVFAAIEAADLQIRKKDKAAASAAFSAATSKLDALLASLA